MVQNQQKAPTHFRFLVEKLHRFEHVLSSIAESSKEEFENFLLSLHAPTRDNFKQFDFLKSRLIFTLSHSQCVVERGFSININKDLLIENLQEKSMVYQRVIDDHLQVSKVDLHNFLISSGLPKSCKSARQRYLTHLEEQRSKVKTECQTKES